jgi:hypothetical protein
VEDAEPVFVDAVHRAGIDGDLERAIVSPISD